MKFLSHPILRKSWFFKLWVIVTVMLCLGIAGAIYARQQLDQWLKEQNATIKINSWRPSFGRLGFPSVVIGKTTIKFKNPQTSLESIEFSKAIIELDLLLLLKRFLFAVTFPVEVENLRVSFKDQTYMKSEKIGGHIVKKWNIYEFDNIVVKSFQFGVLQYQDESRRHQLVHLVLYRIEGKINYQIKSQLISLLLEIPEASLQMPEGKGYSLKAEGELQLTKQKDAPVPVQGKINLKIKQFFNLLSCFHPIGIVSLVEKNLNTAQGKSSSVEGFSSNHTNEEKEKDVTLKVGFEPNAIYVGPLKVYP